MRTTGTKATGVRCPIVKEGDDIASIVAKAVRAAVEIKELDLQDGDIVGVTESVVARAQGNYVTVDHIAEEAQRVLPGDELCVFNPIFSRNRFSMILKGLARAYKTIHLCLGNPIDEVGNVLRDHPFTGVNYDEYYKEICKAEGCKVTVAPLQYPTSAYTRDNVLICSIHRRDIDEHIYRNTVKDYNRKPPQIANLTDLCNQPSDYFGFNVDYGLLGSNKATEERLKLFPRNCDLTSLDIQSEIRAQSGKKPEVLIYGDGAFKDPVGKIWELADPVVSPGHTDGLVGTPNEIKMKYIADTKLKDLSGDEAIKAMKSHILEKKEDLVGDMTAQGTTPRQYTDLLGSLCDLISGSGDKGTPVVVIQGYFDNYATE